MDGILLSEIASPAVQQPATQNAIWCGAMPPPPMSTGAEASNGQWQWPLVRLQPVLIIALVLWVKFIYGYVLSLFFAFSHKTRELLLCVEQLKDCAFGWRCSASLASATWGPDTYMTNVPPSPLTVRRPCVLCLESISSAVPFNLALLLLEMTKKLTVVFVVCCQRWHTWVTNSFQIYNLKCNL